jgi:cysteinyl-tRNA synthetase
MIEKNLGLPIDIHGGGHDLIFPHHENELAQGRCATHGGDYARYWMHNGFLDIEGEKMSKSLGNVRLVHDLIEQIPGEAIRWALLAAHYRAPLDWTGELIDQSRKALDRLYGVLQDLAREAGALPLPDEATVERLVEASGFQAALEDDLNTPRAFSTLFSLADGLRAGLMNKAEPQTLSDLRAALLGPANLIGFLQADPDAWFKGGADEGLQAKVEALIAARATARAAKNWPEADRIRAELTALNVEVLDGPGGAATWRMKE